MSALISRLRSKDESEVKKAIEEACLSPEQALTVAEWHSDVSVGQALATAYVRANAGEKTRIGIAAKGLLQEWSPPKAERSSAALDLLLFLSLARPKEVSLGDLRGIAVEMSKTAANREWAARILSLCLDYLADVKLEERSKKGFEQAFWMHQHWALKERYPAVIWAGILDVDVTSHKSEAFKTLPELAKTPEAARSLTDVFPWISSEMSGGYDFLCERLCALDSHLTESVKSTFRNWLAKRHAWPPWAYGLGLDRKCEIISQWSQNDAEQFLRRSFDFVDAGSWPPRERLENLERLKALPSTDESCYSRFDSQVRGRFFDLHKAVRQQLERAKDSLVRVREIKTQGGIYPVESAMFSPPLRNVGV